MYLIKLIYYNSISLTNRPIMLAWSNADEKLREIVTYSPPTQALKVTWNDWHYIHYVRNWYDIHDGIWLKNAWYIPSMNQNTSNRLRVALYVFNFHCKQTIKKHALGYLLANYYEWLHATPRTHIHLEYTPLYTTSCSEMIDSSQHIKLINCI